MNDFSLDTFPSNRAVGLVESNDALYGNDQDFIAEIHQRLSRLCEQIIQILKDVGNTVIEAIG